MNGESFVLVNLRRSSRGYHRSIPRQDKTISDEEILFICDKTITKSKAVMIIGRLPLLTETGMTKHAAKNQNHQIA